jgi:tyrosyl-tRNA synthetase
VRVNGEIVQDEFFKITEQQIEDGRVALQVGKKRHHHILVV